MNLPKYSRSDYVNISLCSLFVIAGLLARKGGEIHWATYFFACCFLILLLSPIMRARAERAREEHKEFVEFDREIIKRYVPNKIEEHILWSEIGKISISTNDKGPFFDDVYWVISGVDESKGVVISNDAIGLPELLQEFQKLPSFNHEKVVEAMGCTENAWFVLWQRNT